MSQGGKRFIEDETGRALNFALFHIMMNLGDIRLKGQTFIVFPVGVRLSLFASSSERWGSSLPSMVLLSPLNLTHRMIVWRANATAGAPQIHNSQGSFVTGIKISPSAFESAFINRKIATTRPFILGGDRAYASSYAVTLQKHSLNAPRTMFGACHQILIGATVSHVDA